MHFEDNYSEILLSDRPMIDLRAPIEFAKGAFSGSTNLPLMTDDERARVGTCYKQHGQQAAIDLGHSIVSGPVKAERMESWISELGRQDNPLIYCFRGGLRSQTVGQFLADAGVDTGVVRGGYKAMRRFLIDSLNEMIDTAPFVVLAGQTGSGKTRVLTQLNDFVDLEGLAHHRGSAFGRTLVEQPAQISFENNLSVAVLRAMQMNPTQLFIEDEARLIGRCALVLELYEALQKAPRVMVEEPVHYRVEVTLEDYVVTPSLEYQQHYGDQWQQPFSEHFLGALSRIKKRLGGERYTEIEKNMKDALELQFNRADLSGHRAWISDLLVNYYDPMYNYQLSKKNNPVIFRGSGNEVIEWARQ